MSELRRLAVAGLVALGWIGLVACDVVVGGLGNLDKLGGRASETWTRTYPLDTGGRIQVINTNGKIEVEAYDGASVEVKAEKLARAMTEEAAKEILKQVEIKDEASAEQIRLETKQQRRFSGGSLEVKYHLRVPLNAKVNLETTNGGIEVVGVRGEVRAETVNGGVVGRQLGSAITASSVNGGLVIDVATVAADIKLDTTNGGIRLTLPETGKADISARVTNGGIRVSDLELDQVREKSRRRLEARLNGGGPKIDLETTNGGIRISARSQ
ncbi:MAG: DUF4097 family beta strand repeat protein [Acidobacteria bacterium]|nr:DUF4097 family beta strand repeat protein [Acidobacteriota bacterium]MBI3261998.1 DUF4097 family beta strand repeat protein [Acidobacteriota bacterium]